MALLPDLGAAVLGAVVVFLLALGFLVVFIETISFRRLVSAIASLAIVAVVLGLIGETGVALLAVGVGGALVANHAFEWLTTR